MYYACSQNERNVPLTQSPVTWSEGPALRTFNLQPHSIHVFSILTSALDAPFLGTWNLPEFSSLPSLLLSMWGGVGDE